MIEDSHDCTKTNINNTTVLIITVIRYANANSLETSTHLNISIKTSHVFFNEK